MIAIEVQRPIPGDDWIFGALGGFVGGIVFALSLQLLVPTSIETVIPAIYGIDQPALVIGWSVHIALSVVFGLLYVIVANTSPIVRYSHLLTGGALVGAIYGIVLWVISWVLLLPLWLAFVGFADAPPFPNVDLLALLGHVLYGFFLGVVYTGSWSQAEASP